MGEVISYVICRSHSFSESLSQNLQDSDPDSSEVVTEANPVIFSHEVPIPVKYDTNRTPRSQTVVSAYHVAYCKNGLTTIRHRKNYTRSKIS